MYDSLGADMWAVLPMVIVTLAGLIVIVVDCFNNDSKLVPLLALAGVIVAGVVELMRMDSSGFAFMETVRVGGISSYINIILLISAGMSIALSIPYLEHIKHNFGEVHGLILFATLGAMVLGSANSMVVVFVGLETMSICLYILAGLVRDELGSIESALKYFLLGAFSTGFFLYGIALLYGATGTMSLPGMSAVLAENGYSMMFWLGLALLLVGFFFKVAAVPFHMWTPDVYQGAPTTLTGFMATASKAAAFASLLVILWHLFPVQSPGLSALLSIVAVLTMVVGNFLAIKQDNVKRMLAYSSVAHAGYILVGLVAGNAAGYSGTLFYLLVYTLMNLGAFGVMAILEWDEQLGRVQTLDSLSGVGMKRPILGVCMAFFMFSLTGFPPFAGFIGKLRVFMPAIDAGFLWLAIVGFLASVVSAYYYLRVLVYMWMKSPEDSPEGSMLDKIGINLPLISAIVLIICAASQIGLSIFPAPAIEMIDSFFLSSVTGP